MMTQARNHENYPMMIIQNDLDSKVSDLAKTYPYNWVSKFEKDGFMIAAPSLGMNFYGDVKNETQYQKSHMFKEGKPHGGGAWHPGQYGHHLWGSQLSWHLLGMLEETLLKMEKEIKSMTSGHQLLKPSDLNLDWVLDEYGKSSKEFSCKFENEEGIYCSPTLQCFTSLLPHHGHDFGIENLLLDDKQLREIKFDRKDVHGKEYPPLNWTYELFQMDRQAVLKVRGYKTGIQDEKWIWAGNKKQGTITFHLKVEGKGPLEICQCVGNWGKYPDQYVFLQVFVFLAFSLLTKYN